MAVDLLRLGVPYRTGSPPRFVLFGQTDGARSVSRGNGRELVHKEDAMLYITPTRNRLERDAAVKTAIDFTAAVAVELAWGAAEMWLAVSPDQGISPV